MKINQAAAVVTGILMINGFSLSAATTPGLEVKPEIKSEVSEKETIAGKEFTSEKGKYKVTFPDNWDVKEGYMDLDVYALSPVEGPDDTFRENVNIIFSDIDQNMSKEEYYNTNIKYLEKFLTDYKLLDQGTVTLDGQEARWIEYSHRMGQVNATLLQYLILDGKRVYVITFAASPDSFGKYDKIFREIASSFKFIK